MKKAVTLILALCMIFVSALCGCTASAAKKEENANGVGAENGIELVLQIGNPVMTINGAERNIDEEGTVPVIVNSRTMLPVRAVVEELGGTVDWDNDTRTVTLICGENEIKLVIDSTLAYLNGEETALDTAPVIINGRTMLPIRFIAESFKFSVDWVQAEQKIIIKIAEKVTEEQTAKSLVVYFSATGTTEKLAEKIAQVSGSDIFEIEPQDPYTSEDLNYSNDNCRANREMNDASARPAIAASVENISEYETVFIGYPIWWGTMPRIINTFAETYDLSEKTVMPFCTSGGSSIDESVSALREVFPNSTVTQGFRGRASTAESEIQTWLDENGFQNTESQYIKLISGENEIIIKLSNNSAAKNFARMLPAELDFEDYNNTEKIAYLTSALDCSEAQRGIMPVQGVLAYYEPWGNLALFYKDSGYSQGLVTLGQVEKGAEYITSLSGKVPAEIYR